MSNESQGQLSQIMSAEAKIGMNEVVSVQLAKYETGLYDRKDELSKNIGQLQKDLEMHNAVALKGADFKKYDGVPCAKLGLVSKLKGAPTLSWETNRIRQEIGLYHTDQGTSNSTGFSKSFSVPITKQNIDRRDKMLKDIEEATDALRTIVSAISNMSRKERQVKARISEIRLQEVGIDLNSDDELKKLTHIDL